MITRIKDEDDEFIINRRSLPKHMAFSHRIQKMSFYLTISNLCVKIRI